jgi:hypothetical protein
MRTPARPARQVALSSHRAFFSPLHHRLKIFLSSASAHFAFLDQHLANTPSTEPSFLHNLTPRVNLVSEPLPFNSSSPTL